MLQTTVYHRLHRLSCVSQTKLWRTECNREEGGCFCLAANPGFTILQLYRFYPFWCSLSFLLWSSLIFPLFGAPNSFRHSHLIWGRKCGFFSFLLIFGFCCEDHYWLSHLMQCNEANTFSLSYLFATKTFVTNCVLCWTGTSSCGTEKRNGGVDMWTRIGEIKGSTPKKNKNREQYFWGYQSSQELWILPSVSLYCWVSESKCNHWAIFFTEFHKTWHCQNIVIA